MHIFSLFPNISQIKNQCGKKLFSLFELLISIGVFQGLVSSITLIRKTYGSKQANILLALFLMSFSAICLKTIIYSAGLDLIYPSLSHIPLAFETLLPAIAYLYCISITRAAFSFSLFQLLHILPFMFFMFYGIYVYINTMSIENEYAINNFLVENHYFLIKEIEDYLTVVLIILYISLSNWEVKKFQSHANNLISDNGHAIFLWVRRLQILMTILVVFLVINMTLDRAILLKQDSNLHWQLYFLYLSAVIYFIGYSSPHLAFDLKLEEPKNPIEYSGDAQARDEELQKLANEISVQIHNGQLYLDPELSLHGLASRIGMKPNIVSHVINRQFGMSFRDYINQHRIDFAKQQLLSNEKSASILSLAFDSGFNSEASFYRIFKKHVGMTPTQYVKSNQSTK